MSQHQYLSTYNALAERLKSICGTVELWYQKNKEKLGYGRTSKEIKGREEEEETKKKQGKKSKKLKKKWRTHRKLSWFSNKKEWKELKKSSHKFYDTWETKSR